MDSQLELLVHRGPDSSGVFARGRGAVGQNRLAIIDLVTGDPPITAAGGTIGVALNGEIYNYRSLRRELAAEGHHLTTQGDTEVLAHLAEGSEPPELARRAHGMFAFAIWDSVRERLVLGRDRLGKKPLYYWFGPDVLVFGSEIKAVLAHPAVPRRLDPEAIPAYLGFGYVPSPRTFFEGIYSVPPGHVLVVEADWGIRLQPYWSPPVPGRDGSATLPLSLADAATEVRSRLSSAVARRLVSDVPLGAFLSGGVDSSAVVALMAEQSDRPVRTFTIGFEDREGYDEREYARAVAERCGTDHTEFVVAPSAVDLIDRLVWHHDQPFGDSSAIPTFLLSELTRSEVTVALCGDGGDELFAGYERFTAGRAVAGYRRLPAPLRRLMRRSVDSAVADPLGRRGAKLRRFAAAADLGLPDAFRSWISYVPDHLVAGLTGEGSAWAIEDYRRIWAESAGARPLDRLLNLNLRTYLLDDLLPKVDR
ncbi:MAG: asparagine synthase (glutamine-hydrolyzing), partial [Acidimicrobiales bacterium]